MILHAAAIQQSDKLLRARKWNWEIKGFLLCPKKIENEEVKQNVTNQLRACLDIGILIYSKDIRSWLQERDGIDIRKTITLQYLKNWGIE